MMELLFSNGTDKLQITLPDRTLAAEEWFTAPLALQVGGLNFYISNEFQKEDFELIFEKLQTLLSCGKTVKFSQLEEVLAFTPPRKMRWGIAAFQSKSRLRKPLSRPFS